MRGANTFLKRKYNSRIWNILHDRFPSVFPMFSTNKCWWRLRAFSSFGRRTREPRLARPQKAYVEALHGWLSKFIVPEVEFYSRSKNVAMQYQVTGPPLLVICNDWLASLQKLPDKMVTVALKSVVKDVRTLWLQQNKEKQQKRKVDRLTRDLERRYSSASSHKVVETRMLEYHVTDRESEAGNDHHQEEEECMM